MTMRSRNVAPDFREVFQNALSEGDDRVALTLLHNGCITTDTKVQYLEDEKPQNVLLAAVYYEREIVVRALVYLGADINRFYETNESNCCDSGASAVGIAIEEGSVPMLATCHQLGANLTHVIGSHSAPYSAVQYCLSEEQPECFLYLLDQYYSPKSAPIRLSPSEKHVLCSAAFGGARSMQLYRVLELGGYNFVNQMAADIFQIDEDEDDYERPAAGEITFADFMVTCSHDSADERVMRYIFHLGVSSEFQKIMRIKSDMADCSNCVGVGEMRDDEILGQFICAACDKVCKTGICMQCKVARYCSGVCQKAHWDTGGHRQECLELVDDQDEFEY